MWGFFNVCIVITDIFPLDIWFHLIERKSGFRIRKLIRGFLKIHIYTSLKSKVWFSLGIWKLQPPPLLGLLELYLLEVAWSSQQIEEVLFSNRVTWFEDHWTREKTAAVWFPLQVISISSSGTKIKNDLAFK